MNIHDLMIVGVASFIGLIYLLIIRSFDLYEKESYLKLFLVALFGGAIAMIFSLLLYSMLDVRYNFIDAFVKIGPVEEISKLASLIILSRFIKSDLNELVDGLVYIAAISLGYSVIENIFYAFKLSDPYLVLFERSIYSVIGHISFSGYLGIAYYIHIKIKKNFLGILLAIILASFAHGLYDAILFHKEINVLFRFAFYGIIIFHFILFKLALGFSGFRKTLSLELFEPIDSTIFLKCCRCNNSIRSKTLKFGKIRGVICKNCNSLVLQGENVSFLLKYFRPTLRIQKYLRNLSLDKKTVYLDYNNKVSYNWQRSVLSSPIEDLSEWLNVSNIQDRKKVLETPIVGPILLYLGIRHIL